MRVLRILLLLVFGSAVALPLGGCSWFSRPNVEIPKEVRVPVAVPCIDPGRRPERPPMRSEAELMAMDRGPRTIAAWSELKKLWGYAPQLEAVVEGCSRIPAARPP
jgi:hypothetical protein